MCLLITENCHSSQCEEYIALSIIGMHGTHTHTHTTQAFYGSLDFVQDCLVNWYQKGKTNLDFNEARNSQWKCNMWICTSLLTGNHATSPPLSFFTGRMPFMPPNQQRQNTEDSSRYAWQCRINFKLTKVHEVLIITTLQPFYGPLDFVWTTRLSQHPKSKTKTNLDFLEQESVSGNGVSWPICKSASRCRHTTTPAPHQSVF